MLRWLAFWKFDAPYLHIAVWFLTALAFFALTSVATWFGGFLGGIFGMLVVAGLGFSWIGVFIISLQMAWGRRSEPRNAIFTGTAPIAALAVAAALALPVVWGVAWLLGWGSFLANRSTYEDVVRVAESGKYDASPDAYKEYGDTTFLLDIGPPRRVAILEPGGFLDNWSGIVYDPTGDVMLADGFDPVTGKFAAPDRVTKLFGGDLVSCRPLIGDFYRCSFT